MVKLSWSEMMQAHPASHLVVGAVDRELVLPPGELIERLLEKVRPRGRYALTTLSEPHGPAVYCAFEQEPDAERFARAIQANGACRYPGWASQCWFRLNAATAAAITAALGGRDG